jgi:hypothetical protein
MRCENLSVMVGQVPDGARSIHASKQLIDLLLQYIGYQPDFYALTKDGELTVYIRLRSEEDKTLFHLCLGENALSVAVKDS